MSENLHASTTLSGPVRLAYNDLKVIIRTGQDTFMRVGAALAQIKEKKLYREEYGSFEEFCQAEYGWTGRHARRLIDASEVVKQLEAPESGPIGHTSSLNESQARELGKAPEDKRVEVYQKAVDESGGKPTAASIKRAREKVAPKPKREPAPEPEVDPASEWEKAEAEVVRLTALVETLQADDLASEHAALAERYAALEGRLNAQIETTNEATRKVEYYAKLLRDIREILDVENNAEIMPFLSDLLR